MKTFQQFHAYQKLTEYSNSHRDRCITELFTEDINRNKKFSIQWEDFLFDYSKNNIDEEGISLLLSLAKEANIKANINDMFSGKEINKSESKQVLHIALRNTIKDIEDKSIGKEVSSVLEKMYALYNNIISGKKKSFHNKNFRYIVNVGIGGSYLGTKMVIEALEPYHEKLQCLFVSNLDSHNLKEVLNQINLEETLFIIASKTFTTEETITNANQIKKILLEQYNQNEKCLEDNFIALSSNTEEAKKFGISSENIFPFWDWVGGRYSLWSCIGLPILLTVGEKNFKKLLRGANAMDNHFINAPIEKNLPTIMALIGIWNINFLNHPHLAVLPYDHRLRSFPDYLQQLDMESNGKSINNQNKKVTHTTAPIVWGGVGTNGQHSFHQLLHQGTITVPCDFIACVNPGYNLPNHSKLLSHCFAQSQALMEGRDHKNLYQTFEGNRPSNTLLIKELTPYNLGAMLALYEHKIFTQGVVWGINSFDQWGVELGKELATQISHHSNESNAQELHPATEFLLSFYNTYKSR